MPVSVTTPSATTLDPALMMNPLPVEGLVALFAVMGPVVMVVAVMLMFALALLDDTMLADWSLHPENMTNPEDPPVFVVRLPHVIMLAAAVKFVRMLLLATTAPTTFSVEPDMLMPLLVCEPVAAIDAAIRTDPASMKMFCVLWSEIVIAPPTHISVPERLMPRPVAVPTPSEMTAPVSVIHERVATMLSSGFVLAVMAAALMVEIVMLMPLLVPDVLAVMPFVILSTDSVARRTFVPLFPLAARSDAVISVCVKSMPRPTVELPADTAPFEVIADCVARMLVAALMSATMLPTLTIELARLMPLLAEPVAVTAPPQLIVEFAVAVMFARLLPVAVTLVRIEMCDVARLMPLPAVEPVTESVLPRVTLERTATKLPVGLVFATQAPPTRTVESVTSMPRAVVDVLAVSVIATSSTEFDTRTTLVLLLPLAVTETATLTVDDVRLMPLPVALLLVCRVLIVAVDELAVKFV